MLTSEVLGYARQIMSDTNSVRWADSTLRTYLHGALYKVGAWRPDLFIDDDGVLVTIETITDNSTVLPFGPETREALAHLIASSCFAEEGDDRVALERSQYHENRARASLLGA